MNKAASLTVVICLAAATMLRAQTPAPVGKPADSPKAEKKEKAKGKGGGLPGFGDSAAPTGPITTEIFADEASFDSGKYVGVFSGHVIVNDPRFNLQSDKLTIFIRKGADKSAKSEEGAAAKSPENGGSEGLEKAIAEGNVAVVKETAGANGAPPTRAVGRSEKAVYTTNDGNVELTGSPRVQQGLNSHVATTAETVMILNQSGQLTTHGPSRTEIRQEPKPSPAPEAPKPAAAVPAASAVVVPSSSPKPSAKAQPVKP